MVKLRLGLNRTPPLAKRHYLEDDFEYGYNNLYQPTRGRRDVPLPPKPRRTSFRPTNDDDFDEFETTSGRQLLRDSVTGEYIEYPSEFDGRSKYNSSRAGQRRRRNQEGGRIVRFERVSNPPPSDWYETQRDSRGDMASTYQGGYDFRDDVDSIDSDEGERRRQVRKARMQNSQPSSSRRSASPGVSSLRKISRYDRPNVPAGRSSEEGYRNSRAQSGGRIGGSTMASTIATNEEHWELMRSMSSFSCPPVNPQLLNAQRIPDLPPGYLQRNDGVVLSLGSSLASEMGSERYADAETRPEDAAETVVKNLRALGYTVDDDNGILGSDSDSGSFSRYGGGQSKSFSMEAMSGKSKASAASSRASKQRTVKSHHSDYGIQSPPAVALPDGAKAAGVSMSSGKTGTREKTESPSSEVHSVGSTRSNIREKASVGSRGSRKSRKESQGIAVAPSKIDNSIIANNTDDPPETLASTEIADGSTLTSGLNMGPEPGAVVVDIQNTKLATQHINKTPSTTENRTYSTKRVGFSGEYPEMTKAGERVPELVLKAEGIKTAVSDLSNQQSLGDSELSSVSFTNRPDPFSVLCDKLLYSCRITAFPLPRPS